MGIRDLIEKHKGQIQKHNNIKEIKTRLDIQRYKQDNDNKRKIQVEKQQLTKLKQENKNLKYAGIKNLVTKIKQQKPTKKRLPTKGKRLKIKTKPAISDTKTNNPLFQNNTNQNPFTTETKKEDKKNIWEF